MFNIPICNSIMPLRHCHANVYASSTSSQRAIYVPTIYIGKYP